MGRIWNFYKTKIWTSIVSDILATELACFTAAFPFNEALQDQTQGSNSVVSSSI